MPLAELTCDASRTSQLVIDYTRLERDRIQALMLEIEGAFKHKQTDYVSIALAFPHQQFDEFDWLGLIGQLSQFLKENDIHFELITHQVTGQTIQELVAFDIDAGDGCKKLRISLFSREFFDYFQPDKHSAWNSILSRMKMGEKVSIT